ncbi:unnamed protein product [Lota lota]
MITGRIESEAPIRCEESEGERNSHGTSRRASAASQPGFGPSYWLLLTAQHVFDTSYWLLLTAQHVFDSSDWPPLTDQLASGLDSVLGLDCILWVLFKLWSGLRLVLSGIGYPWVKELSVLVRLNREALVHRHWLEVLHESGGVARVSGAPYRSIRRSAGTAITGRLFAACCGKPDTAA